MCHNPLARIHCVTHQSKAYKREKKTHKGEEREKKNYVIAYADFNDIVLILLLLFAFSFLCYVLLHLLLLLLAFLYVPNIVYKYINVYAYA